MTYQIQVPHVWENLFTCLFETPETKLDHLLPNIAGIEKVEVSQSRIAVFGGKNVGKSTYTKWLMNKILDLLAKRTTGTETTDNSSSSTNSEAPFILYIDVDPGQAEFTPPGVISVSKISEPIHGPNFSHLCTPLLSKFLGAVNVSDCPRHYLKCVQELLEFVNQDERYKNVPWILNTMGFVKGLGISLNCKVIYMMKPTIVMQILMEEEGHSRSNNTLSPFIFDPTAVFEYLYTHERQQRHHIFDASSKPIIDFDNLQVLKYQFITFDSVIGDLVDKSHVNVKSKDLRDEVIVSYFSELASQTEDNNLLSVPPRVVSLSSITIGTMNSSLPYEDIIRSMNGNLVALCHFSEDLFFTYTNYTKNNGNSNADTDGNWRRPASTASSEKSSPREIGKYLLNGNRYSNEFYGYGIVRSIDKENSLLYIITPVSEEILKARVNCIVTAGCIGLPTQLYLTGLANSTSNGDDLDLAYVVSKRQSKSKLNEATRKQFIPKRLAHRALKNCLL